MINKKMYLSFIILFCMVFILFLTFGIVSDYFSVRYTNSRSLNPPKALVLNGIGMPNLDKPGEMDRELGNRTRAAIISQTDASSAVLVEWCQLNKYRYQLFESLPDPEDAIAFDIILFGDIDIKNSGILLAEYAAAGVTMIFTQPLDFAVLAVDPGLMDFFGIRECIHANQSIAGIKIFSGFFIGGERIYQAGDDYATGEQAFDQIPYYTLRPGYKVFATGLFRPDSGTINERLPPLLWRTYTGSSFIYVINSGLFSGETVLGTITAFLSDLYEIHIYPVVNAQTIAAVNFPLYSDLNNDVISKRYSRDTASLTRSILWPDVMKIMDHYGGKMSVFMASEMKDSGVGQNQIRDVDMYFKGISKKSGVIALSANPPGCLSYPECLDHAQSFFSAVAPEYKFTSLYTDESSIEELVKQSKVGPLDSLRELSFVLTPFSGDRRLISTVDGKILAIETTHDGFRHTYQDDVRMLSLETALGMYTQTIDFSRVYYPSGDEDDWSRLGNFWSSGITHLNHFKAFDRTNVYELEDRVRSYLSMDYTAGISPGSIDVDIDNNQTGSWFILRTHHLDVVRVDSGTARKVDDNAWLIHTDAPAISIIVEKTDTIGQ